MKAQLTQEAKDALIKALKEKICERKSDYYNDRYVKSGIEQSISIVESFPTSDEGRWIPCSERLPDNSEYVIALQSYSDSILVAYYSGGKWYSDSEYQIAGITHWQYLPKPPTE